jgi:hypothetical protein
MAARLAEQQGHLADLADRLRSPLGPDDLAPAPGGGPADVAELRVAVDAAAATLAEARHVATLPRLLPGWTSRFARAAVVYGAFGIPSLLLTIFLAMAGVHGNRTVLIWFVVIWPAVTAIVGGLVVRFVSRSPLDGELARGGRSVGDRVPGGSAPDRSAPEGSAPEGSAPESSVQAGRRSGPSAASAASAVEQRVEQLLRDGHRRRPRVYPWLGVLVAWASWLVPGFLLDRIGSLWPG